MRLFSTRIRRVTYRASADERSCLGRFWYGPFPLPRARWLALFVLAVLAPVFALLGTHWQRLSCDRAVSSCRYVESWASFASERQFSIADVREVRFVDQLGKNRTEAESAIVFGSGHELRVARASRVDAHARFGEIERFFQPGGAAALTVDTRGSPLFLLLGAAIAVAFLVVIGRSARWVLPFRVTVWRDRVRIRQLPLGALRELGLTRPVRVRVRQPAAGSRRVVIETEVGEVVLATAKLLGRRAHVRAAQRLAELLEIELGPPESLPARAAPPGRRRLLLLVAAGLVSIAALSVAVSGISSKKQGKLEIECRTRCRFQGMECLPGGRVQMALAPGQHAIEIWTASGDSLWTPKQATVRIGETTHFVCEL
jgi:hypothetical protein